MEREDEGAVGLCQGVGQRELPSGFTYLHGCGIYRLAVSGIGHGPFDDLLGRRLQAVIRRMDIYRRLFIVCSCFCYSFSIGL